jgi:hypothetical protein
MLGADAIPIQTGSARLCRVKFEGSRPAIEIRAPGPNWLASQ